MPKTRQPRNSPAKPASDDLSREEIREIVEAVKLSKRPATIVESPRKKLERWIITQQRENDDHD
jgi:hypothetical protein